jgi:hypothetical protein
MNDDDGTGSLIDELNEMEMGMNEEAVDRYGVDI